MNQQLASLQVLRAVAALSVLAFHLSDVLINDYHAVNFALFPAGADGVDIFFVISGFIMCHTTERPDQRAAGPFAVKRLVRILPLYWGMTLALFAVAMAMPSLLNNTTATWDGLWKSLGFVPYISPDGRLHPLLFLGWTLNYEMFFYAVFSLCLLVAPGRRILAVIAVMCVLRAIGLAIQPRDPVVFVYTDGMLLEFVFGCLVFLMWKHQPALLKKLAWLGWVGAALILIQNVYQAVPLGREFKKGLPAMLIVMGVLSWEMKAGRIRNLFVRLGDASYSLYLGHIYVVELVSKLLVAALGAGLLAAVIGMPLIVVLVCVLSILAYKWFEKPSNDWLRDRFLGRKPKPAPAAASQSA
jgi:peptidoglycan/LPS O-acetylase OafA/YrhL